MSYDLEKTKILNTIRRTGNSGIVKVISPSTTDPFSGIKGPEVLVGEFYFCVVSYSREDFANPSISNGFIKILVPPTTVSGDELANLKDVLEAETNIFELPDGTRFYPKHVQITRPDGVTPILARIFLGG